MPFPNTITTAPVASQPIDISLLSQTPTQQPQPQLPPTLTVSAATAVQQPQQQVAAMKPMSMNDDPTSLSSSLLSFDTLSNPSCFHSFLDVPSPNKKMRLCVAPSVVRFVEKPTATHPSPRTEEELRQAWYSESEIESFSRDRKRTVRALRKVDGDLMSLNHNKYCIRGLESYQSGRFNRALRRQRQSVISGVLEQQSLQRSCGVVNPVALSQIATRQSQWAKRWAMELASIDERERYTSIFDDHDDLLLDQIRECKRRKRIMEKREGETASIASSSNSSASTTTSLSTFGSTPSSEDDSTTCRDNTTRILNEALNVKVVQVEEIPSNRY